MSQESNSNSVTSTEHPRVFRAGPAFGRGETQVAGDIADAIDDDWRVVITIGPYRPYNIQYNLEPDSNIVHLDFYSVRPATGYNRHQVISHIKTGIEQAKDQT